MHNVNVITCPHVSFSGHTDIYGRQKLENIAMTLFIHKLTPEEIAKIKLLEDSEKEKAHNPTAWSLGILVEIVRRPQDVYATAEPPSQLLEVKRTARRNRFPHAARVATDKTRPV